MIGKYFPIMSSGRPDPAFYFSTHSRADAPSAVESRQTQQIRYPAVKFSVSVIIPSYNREAVLGRAIESVLRQTLAPEEVIVVDDGSSDGTAGLVRRDFPQCRYLVQQNRGVSAARNLGIATATGTWLAFLDSDDEWLPGKLEAQYQALQQSSGCRLCHTEEIWIRNGKRVNAMRKHGKSGGWIYQRCLPLCVISPSSVVIHRDVFRSYGGFDESLPACEDYDLWLRICAREPVAFVEQAQIIKYGGHDDQLSRRYWGMDRFRVSALEKMLQSGVLAAPDAVATADMLIEKCRILALGATKRGAAERAARYEALARRYQSMASTQGAAVD